MFSNTLYSASELQIRDMMKGICVFSHGVEYSFSLDFTKVCISSWCTASGMIMGNLSGVAIMMAFLYGLYDSTCFTIFIFINSSCALTTLFRDFTFALFEYLENRFYGLVCSVQVLAEFQGFSNT